MHTHYAYMKVADDSYYLVRRAQLKIVKRSHFQNGELYEIMNRAAFEKMAEKLAEKYFYKSGPTVFDEAKELYKLYLCLSPTMQKIRNSFKVDWTKGHAISWLRRLFNGRVRHWYYTASEHDRNHDIAMLHTKLRSYGIADKKFLDTAAEKYLCFWNSIGMKGALANCVFDPFMFNVSDSGLRISNSTIQTAQKPSEGFLNILEKPLDIVSYQVVVYQQSSRTHINVTIRQDVIEDYKKRCEIIISTRTTPQYKLIQLASLINQMIETAKYAKDSFYQVKELQQWTDKKFRKLAGNEKKFKAIISMITTRFIENNVSIYTYQRTNFFWDQEHNKVPEKTFMIYYSPYREL